MLLVFGILALVVAWLLFDPSTRGYGGSIFFGIVGVVLILLGLHDDD
jgi:hypothetical protein